MAIGWKVEGAIRSLDDTRGMQFKYARVLHVTLLVPVLMYGSEAFI